MRKSLISSILIAAALFIVPAIVGGVSAAYLKFDQSSLNIQPGNTFQLQVQVDTGIQEVTSVDSYILFPAALIEAVSVADGSFFPTVTHNIESGKVYIAGFVDDPATSKTGTGTIATITFRANTNGTAQIRYDCREGASDSSKVIKNDINATNIIVCSQNTNANVVIGTGGGGPTVAPTSTPGGGTFPAPTVLPQTGGNKGGGNLPSSLPQAGNSDNMMRFFSLSGFSLIMLGLVLRFAL